MPARTHQEQCGGEGTRERDREREKTKRDGRGESGRSSARITKVEKKGCWNEGGWSERRRRKKKQNFINYSIRNARPPKFVE